MSETKYIFMKFHHSWDEEWIEEQLICVKHAEEVRNNPADYEYDLVEVRNHPWTNDCSFCEVEQSEDVQ